MSCTHCCAILLLLYFHYTRHPALLQKIISRKEAHFIKKIITFHCVILYYIIFVIIQNKYDKSTISLKICISVNDSQDFYLFFSQTEGWGVGRLFSEWNFSTSVDNKRKTLGLFLFVFDSIRCSLCQKQNKKQSQTVILTLHSLKKY